MKLMIVKDRKDIMLPRELAVFFSKPTPDWICYIPFLERADYGLKTAVPVFTIGNKGGPNGTTIDSALPQDACTTYGIANAWASWGVPLEEVCVLSASTEQGVVTQFFSEPKMVDPYTPAVPSSRETPVSSAESSVLDPTLFAQRIEGLEQEPSRCRHLVFMPLSKKLDPTDPDDRRELARLFV
ncbi:hypothetical protein BC832DRAFT_474552 [Gaertneriomyces semiglobifer]|nr:hypothetical protein BC832DRAFT_474552 [Gaertneriomyces semiglobifer]